MENWKDIPGYEGMYQVSDLGRVKSLPKKVRFLQQNTKEEFFRITKERILKAGLSDGNYLSVALCNKSGKKTFRIHVLVAMAFLNHVPNRWNVVIDHIDDNKLNNNVNNLQLLTHSENISKGYRNRKDVNVFYDKSRDRYRVKITINKRKHYIGSFKTKEEAKKARNEFLNSNEAI